MAIHRVLIEGHQNVELVTESENRGITGAKREENVAAANDRLVRIIGVQMQSTTNKYPRQDIAGGGDSLACRTTDCNCEINFRHFDFLRSNLAKPSLGCCNIHNRKLGEYLVHLIR